RGRVVALAATRPPGLVRPDVGQRLLRQPVFGGVPGGVAPGVARPGRGRPGWRQHARGGPDQPVAGTDGGTAGPGEVPALLASALSGRTVVELAEVFAVVQL